MAKRKSQSWVLGVGSLALLLGIAFAASVTRADAPLDLEINLGAKLPVTLPEAFTAALKQPVHLIVVPKDLSEEIDAGDISIQVDDSHMKVEITTQTYAQSFSNKTFEIDAKDSNGDIEASAEFSLKVDSVYVVTVIDGPDPDKDPYNFDSPTGTSYFREQPDGLLVKFVNESSRPLIIHGTGEIIHQPFTPIQHGETYINGETAPGKEKLIFKADGPNVVGYYTIHGVYHPERNLIFNASTIPAQAAHL